MVLQFGLRSPRAPDASVALFGFRRAHHARESQHQHHGCGHTSSMLHLQYAILAIWIFVYHDDLNVDTTAVDKSAPTPTMILIRLGVSTMAQ